MIVDAVTAKVQQLRVRWEGEGYEVIERPGPEEFPFEVGYFGHYRPAMLARRGAENHVFEIREAVRSLGRLIERSDEIRQHPDWHFYLMSLEDVVPHDAPGLQGDPPPWPRLERRVEDAVRLAGEAPSRIALLELWSALEGVMRRIAVDNTIPVDLLPAATLIPALYDQGLIPFDSYEPLKTALEVHRRVLHGYDAPEEEIAGAVRTVSQWVCEMLSAAAEQAA
ncbi:MAG TPA: hypothetical protein VF541_09975 [Longimicrobium sp.]